MTLQTAIDNAQKSSGTVELPPSADYPNGRSLQVFNVVIRYGMLTLRVEPYTYAGHGIVTDSYVAAVTRDLPEFGTSAIFASEQRSGANAYNRAYDAGLRLLAVAVHRGLHQPTPEQAQSDRFVTVTVAGDLWRVPADVAERIDELLHSEPMAVSG